MNMGCQVAERREPAILKHFIIIRDREYLIRCFRPISFNSEVQIFDEMSDGKTENCSRPLFHNVILKVTHSSRRSPFRTINNMTQF